MRPSDFDYSLPKECIAQEPLPFRDQSKLMVLDRQRGKISHHRFFELPDLLPPDSVLVLNESRVLPARLLFKLGQGNAEILLIKPGEGNQWECLVRPGEKFQIGLHHRLDATCVFEVLKILPEGARLIGFACDDFKNYLHQHGLAPTPPYIKKILRDPERYQTVYAKAEGSAAAPTAGLHFTENVFQGLAKKGTPVEYLTLHVGLGTFAPVKTENIQEHHLHPEWFELKPETAERLNAAKKAGLPAGQAGKKIVAVGTTSVRVLETCSDEQGVLYPKTGETDIFIYPGYRFKFVDHMITNFHVPRSSLLMLVSAFAGRDLILRAYEIAKKEGYRFFSFGDAMLIR